MPKRYVVESIPDDAAKTFRDLNIEVGDILEVGDRGFPKGPDTPDAPPVTLRRALHSNIAWFVGDFGQERGFLRELAEEGSR